MCKFMILYEIQIKVGVYQVSIILTKVQLCIYSPLSNELE